MIREKEITLKITCFRPLIAEASKVKVLNFMVVGKLDCVMFGYR